MTRRAGAFAAHSIALGLRLATAVIWLICLPFALVEPVQAQKRVALVIGNGNYQRVPRLTNPARDATAIASMFKAAGFDTVQRVNDLGGPALRRTLRDFSDHARDAEVAVVFYAGHGIEVNGTNYLVPVDAVLERDIDAPDEAVPLERVSEVLESAKKLRLIILDACRDNPFVGSMARTIASRSLGRGLSKVEVVTSDTLIAYAAKAGSTAADGEGSNSPFTSALLKHLATPGLDVRLALGRVRDEVLRSTNRSQEPFVYGSLGGSEVVLVPARATPESSAKKPGQTYSPQIPPGFELDVPPAPAKAVTPSPNAATTQPTTTSAQPRSSPSPSPRALEIAMNNVRDEFIRCSVFFSIVVEAAKTRANTGEIVGAYSKAAQGLLSDALQLSGSSEVGFNMVTAKFKMEQDEQMSAIGRNFGNMAILNSRHMSDCVGLQKDMLPTLQMLIKAADIEVDNLSRLAAKKEGQAACLARRVVADTPVTETAVQRTWCETAATRK